MHDFNLGGVKLEALLGGVLWGGNSQAPPHQLVGLGERDPTDSKLATFYGVEFLE